MPNPLQLQRVIQPAGSLQSRGAAFVGALDGITGLVAVHATARLLASHTGALATIRRTSDSSQQTIGAVAGTGLLDQAAITTFTSGGAWVGVSLADQCGVSGAVTQSTSAAQPTGGTTGNYTYLQFDGSDDILDWASALALTNAQIAAVIQRHNGRSEGSLLCGASTVIPGLQLDRYGTGNLGYWNSDGADGFAGSVGDMASLCMVSWTKLGPTATMRFNGVQKGSIGGQGTDTLKPKGIRSANDTGAPEHRLMALVIADTATPVIADIEAALNSVFNLY